MGHLIIHYNKNGNLSDMYQCNRIFTQSEYSYAKIYKNMNSTFYHSLKEMNLCPITNFSDLPSNIIIHDDF